MSIGSFRKWCPVVALSLSLCFSVLPAWAEPFSADLIHGGDGETRQGKIYVGNSRYRLEVTEEGREIVVLVDQKADKTRVLVPADRVFLEFALSNMRSLQNDPFQAFRYSASLYENRPAEVETLNGFKCQKTVVSTQGKDLMTAWIATELGFPIKIVQGSSKGPFVELRNIRKGQGDKALFAVPAGFTQVDRMPMAVPEWAQDIPGAPVVEPPVEQSLSAPQILRVKVVPGFHLKVRGKHQAGTRATYTAVAFKDGRPVTEPSFSSFNPAPGGGAMGVTRKEGPAEADEVIIRVRAGTALITAERIALGGGKTTVSPLAKPTAPAIATAKSAAPASSPAPDAVMLVLDASGSMWGQIEGKTKIQIAQEVIAELMKGWDANMDLGLMAYGHRRKGDCTDIEVLIPMGKTNPQAVTKAVQGIKPVGKTPLSEAVRQGAVELRYTERPASVLLVSDGIETCNADPCTVGAELAMKGEDFTAHVIGFDVKEEEQTGLQCLAERTGGLFLAAADARGLQEALNKAVAKAQEPPRPVVEQPGKASLEAPPRVPAGSIFAVKWEGSNSRGDFITMVEKGAPEGSYLNYAYTDTGNPVKVMAPDKVGAYELRYVFGHKRNTLARQPVSVTPVQASLSPEPEVAAGSFVKIDWKGPNNRGDYISLAAVGARDDEYLTYVHDLQASPVSIQVPDEPGRYEIRYVTGQSRSILTRAQVNVTPVSAWVRPPTEVAAGAEFAIEWKGPNNRGDYITIVQPGASDSEYGEYAYTSIGNPAKLHAPSEPGPYQVRYVLDQSRTALAKADFSVTKVSASVEAPASVAAGADFTVTWQGPNYRGDYITIVPDGAPDTAYTSYAYTSMGSSVTLKAPAKPGRYEVRYIVDQSRTALARAPVTVK